MAAIDLLLGKSQFRTVVGIMKVNGQIAEPGMPLDVAESLSHDYSATPTKNPIEDGSDVTDNIRVENTTLQIEGFITANPLSIVDSALNIGTGIVASGLGAKFGGFAAQLTAAGAGSVISILRSRTPDSGINYPIQAFNALIKLLKNRVPFSVRTRLTVYDNMVITKLSFPQSPEIGQDLKFSATFEQINLVKTATSIVPEKLTKRAGASSTQKLGKQPEKIAKTNSNTTTLFDLFKKVGG